MHHGRAEPFCLRADELELAWPQIRKLLEKIDEPTLNIDAVKGEISDRTVLVWGIARGEIIDCIWITKVEDNGQIKWGTIWLAAGSGLKAMCDAYREYTERYFREQGCAYAQINGRKGWLRALGDYKEAGRIMVKEL